MRAVRFHGKEDVRLEDVPVPLPGYGQVRLKPAYVGICGTDVHEYTRGATLIPTDIHPLTAQTVPVTLGHEISGVIDAVGPGVESRRVGDRVAVQPILSDGSCHACEQGRPNCCLRQGFYGLSANGGLADYLVVEAENALPIPDNMSLELAALVEPLAVGWHAVRTNLQSGCTAALVVGAGPIGLAIVQALKAHSVETIVVVDTNPKKKDHASRAGAHHFIESLDEDVIQSCTRLTPGHAGVHIAFDTAGKQVTLDQCVGSLRVGGTAVNVAIWGGPATVMPNAFALGEKRYAGSSVYIERDFEEVISAISTGAMDPNFMVTSRIMLQDVVEHGIMRLARNPGSTVKVLVDLGAERRADHKASLADARLRTFLLQLRREGDA